MRLPGEKLSQREQQKEEVLRCEAPNMARDGVSSKVTGKDSGFLKDLLEKSGSWSAIVGILCGFLYLYLEVWYKSYPN